MPTRLRPLFLVPSLMTGGPDTAAFLADLTVGLSASDRVSSPAVKAADDLLATLEPLIIEANLAGYELVRVVASAGPDGNAPAFLLDLATYLLDPANQSWTAMTGLTVDWAATSAAVGLHFEPRLALRDEVTGPTSLPSSYAISVSAPAPWIGSLDSDLGGWLAVTAPSADGRTVPDDLAAIVGHAKAAGSATAELVAAFRGAAGAQWDNHGRTAGQLTRCALAPLFDPATWQIPSSSLGVADLASRVDRHIWNAASGWQPSYEQLATLSLEDLFGWSVGPAAAGDNVDKVADALRNDLVRLHLGDPSRISSADGRSRSLGARYDATLLTFDRFGRRPWPVDLFLLLDLGLLALEQRDPAEETLPVLVEREWTEPVLTGRYDEAYTTTSVTAADLATEAAAHALHAVVARESDVVLLNQAGDHIAGYWQARLDAGPGNHVEFKSWIFEGTRDHSAAGIVYDAFFAAGSDDGEGRCTFTETADGIDLQVDWYGTIYDLTLRADGSQIFDPSGTGSSPPDVPASRPFLPDTMLDGVDAAVRPLIEAEERYPLHPAEIALLEGVALRLVEDLNIAAGTSGVPHTVDLADLCTRFIDAFAYFDGGGWSEHLLLARAYVLAYLGALPGNNTPLDPWFAEPPANYLHALSKAQAEQACPNIATSLGIDGTETDQLNTDHRYQWKFRTNTGVGDKWVQARVNKVTLDPLVGWATTWLFGKAKLVLSKADDVEFAIGPDPQWDLIEAEFQKIAPHPDDDWVEEVSEFYDGVLLGMGASIAGGVNLSWETEWSTVNTLSEAWTPDDFAGPFWTTGISWGASVLNTEMVQEAILNTIREYFELGGPARLSGDYSYTQFVTSGKSDVWAIQLGFTDSFGLHAEISIGATGGYLWRRNADPPEPVDPDEIIDPPDPVTPRRTAPVSFEIGRSDLNADGEAALRNAAAHHLWSLSSPSTTLTVTGHASPGDARDLYNLTLSERRAQNVARYLRSYLGPLFAIPPGQIIVQGLGDQQALDEGGPPEDWRRVDVILNGDMILRLVTP